MRCNFSIGSEKVRKSPTRNPKRKKTDAKDPNANKTPFDLLVRATPNGALTKMRSLRFSVKSDVDTPLLLSLSEKDGGRYNTIVWVAKGEWRDIALAPEEFILAVDKTDPKDPDGKLDLDTVESIGITNVMAVFAPFLAASSDGGISASALHLGDHTLLIDDFTASTDPLPARTKDDLTIDSFESDTIHWFAIGDTQMRVDRAAPQKGNALRLDYKQGDATYIFMVRAIPGLKATEKDGIVLDFASAKGSRINITLEEKNGAHYTLALAIPGDNEPYHRLTDFSEFSLGDNTEDPKGHLDPTEIKSITISDSTGALGIGHQKNTLWIGPMSVKLVPKK